MLDTYRSLSSTATFNQWAGFEVLRMAEGECGLRMPWRPADMGQYAGFLHAGLIAALPDTACGLAANTMASGVLSSNVAVDYLAPQLVAQQIIDAITNDAEEVLADPTSQMVKAALPTDLTSLYPALQAQWDAETAALA